MFVFLIDHDLLPLLYQLDILCVPIIVCVEDAEIIA